MFLQYLWGIETSLLHQNILKKSTVFTVPMRNWNLVSDFDELITLKLVFTVPMRNWNTGEPEVMDDEGESFYSTYEELKLT